MKQRAPGLTRRALLLGASAGIGALAGRQCLLPTNHPGPRFPDTAADGRGVVLDDASQLCPTPVASHVEIRDDPRALLSATTRSEAKRAGAPNFRHSIVPQFFG